MNLSQNNTDNLKERPIYIGFKQIEEYYRNTDLFMMQLFKNIQTDMRNQAERNLRLEDIIRNLIFITYLDNTINNLDLILS